MSNTTSVCIRVYYSLWRSSWFRVLWDWTLSLARWC